VYFVHATLETQDGPRFLAAGGAPFCSSPARFAILGREQCAERYYETTLFTPVPTRNRPGLVLDFEERDFLPVGEAPRILDPGAVAGDSQPARPAARRSAAAAGATDPTQNRPTP
jgi:hypothetical protein